MRTLRFLCLLFSFVLAMAPVNRLKAANTPDEFFEKSVRPLLIERCLKCHNAKKQSGELRLDTLAGLLSGGESGAAIVKGKPGESLLISAVLRQDGYEMPPDKALVESEIQILRQWIKIGAPWPKSQVLKPEETADRAKTHWAFQPVGQPRVPAIRGSWGRNPIDAFVLAKLQEKGLSGSPGADRRTLIRRLSYTLTGLPPTTEDVTQFEKDTNPRAYERLVDRLLKSPHYGEHWGRKWLDLARYSDTKGYVYAREERFWLHAWAYRDWVVRAFNRDLAYNRFLLLQIAGDQVADRKTGDLAAMGYLTLGRRFLGVTHEIIDDRIDVVCRGTMALTVSCARCHDHKYDPIPTADYYSLYGVFDSSSERLVPLLQQPVGDATYQSELKNRQEKLTNQLAASRLDSSNRVRQRIGDYLKSQTELEKYPTQGFDQIFQKSDILPAFVRQWADYLQADERISDPVFRHWHAYQQIPPDQFSQQAEKTTLELSQEKPEAVNPLVAKAFDEPPTSFEDVIERYAKLFRRIDEQWKAGLIQAKDKKEEPPGKFEDPSAEQLRQVLYGPTAPCEVPDEPIVHAETFFDSATVTSLWKLQGEVDRWIIRSKVDAPYALCLVDRPRSKEPRIFRRGDPAKKGASVSRHFLSFLAGPHPEPFQRGSGRMELAQAIIDPVNPLTARVIVNRVWAKHFGEGLVPTTSDFGLRAKPPSHPALLDWLTRIFIEEGWSLKKLHRRILLSATFRQSAHGPSDPHLRAKAIQQDPANRLLWRMNSHRLSFEEFRDSLLVAAGKLNRELGGKPVKLLSPPFSTRRTIYGLVDRQFFPSTLRIFDVANPDLHIAERSETTVPQQSLFLMNHPLMLARVRDLARRVEDVSPELAIQTLFEHILQREPTTEEITDAMAFLKQVDPEPSQTRPLTAKDWQYGYGHYDESQRHVTGFKKLPHFTGSAWQGGPKWPDAKLGWVQLTAKGGHPGNDRQHAAVRRWVAPRDMVIQIRSQLRHEAAPGDGIRAFIASSTDGELKSATIHQKSINLDVESLTLKAGDTVDFVVDIGKVLNSDQYLWSAQITEVADANNPTIWNSVTDFPAKETAKLTAREQLAQVLLCSNEFLFVD